MKSKFALALLVLAAVSGLAFVVQQTAGIYILTGSDEVQFKVRSTVEQTTAWLEFSDRGTTKFAVPASGILPIAYGGTGNATGTVTNTTGNAATATSAANSTNFYGTLAVTSLPAGLSTSNYVATGWQILTNAESAWPTAPAAAGAAAFVNSNGVVFVLTSGLGATWTGTNQIAPTL